MGVDLVKPLEIPANCEFVCGDILLASYDVNDKCFYGLGLSDYEFDFIVASSPCEQFSCLAMPNFQPNAPYPELGIKLFNHTRAICEASGVSYLMENVRKAQDYVGHAMAHCGPFYLWGSGVPPILPQGIKKGLSMSRERGLDGKRIYAAPADRLWSTKRSALVATIPAELANCVADYAERLLEQKGLDEQKAKVI